MGRRSRAKGADFERKIAKALRAWLGEDWTVMRNQTDRQAGQGHLAHHGGEFLVTHEASRIFPFAIECKAVEAFHYGHLWREPVPTPLGSTSKLEGFWAQCSRQARDVGRRPLLVWKGNGWPVLAAMAPRDANALFVPGRRMALDIDDEPVVIVCWDDLMTTNPGEFDVLVDHYGLSP